MIERVIALRYFTGTGNSLRVMSVCKELLEKEGYTTDLSSVTENAPVNPDCEYYGFCFPVHSLGIPRIARRYLQGLPKPNQNTKAFLFVTAGDKSDIGWALEEGKEILQSRGYSVVYSDAFEMPNNWVPMSKVPSVQEAGIILQNAEGLVIDAANKILQGQCYHLPFQNGRFGKLGSSFLHGIYHAMGIKRLWKLFKTSEDCNGCGLCKKVCPVGCISMEKGRPKWAENCEQCMRCINYCPQKAIRQLEMIGHGSRRNSYIEPQLRTLLNSKYSQ